jgi:hypothetical protein
VSHEEGSRNAEAEVHGSDAAEDASPEDARLDDEGWQEGREVAMKKFFRSVWSFIVKHKKKALTVVATGAAAAAEGGTGWQTVKAIAKVLSP